MTPPPGDRLQRFVGDRATFRVADREGRNAPDGWRALLRTTIGKAEVLRREILEAHTRGVAPAGASWRDLPMTKVGDGWEIELPLTEPGFFKAKPYLLDPRGWQHWPSGPDIGISVHADAYRTANTVYCAFARMFGPTKSATRSDVAERGDPFDKLDKAGYAVIPPSGKLRDLTASLDHIFQVLGCRILHLLPVSPTPTTYARFGRFGSPYATLDLAAIDPALVVFDKKTTGIDQFRELTYGTHLRGGRVILDMVINHTGWGSSLQENHPEWFLRKPDGEFISPGAWGTVWEDLVELRHVNVELWDTLADTFLTWCRRGVDGFRCDAGYMVPVPAWQYIVAKVQQEYPETLFLLEGLGGAWEATEALLTDGGMQWAYSELFQNYSGVEVAGYLDHSIRQSRRVGLLVHYSETHDNERLGAKGRAWSLLRNRLCGLMSTSGGFGFTCGVEWLASEKVRVHGSTGMRWDSNDNIVPELAALNRLLADHPCFFDGARVLRLTEVNSTAQAWLRISADEADQVMVVVNTDHSKPTGVSFRWSAVEKVPPTRPSSWIDLLGQPTPAVTVDEEHTWRISVPAGGSYCLSPKTKPVGLEGPIYRQLRAQAAWALTAISRVVPAEQIGRFDWKTLGRFASENPLLFLSSVQKLAAEPAAKTSLVGLVDRLKQVAAGHVFPQTTSWLAQDARQVTLVPPGHWLVLHDKAAFRASLDLKNGSPVRNVESIAVQAGFIACFPPVDYQADARLLMERYGFEAPHVTATIQFLAPEPIVQLSKVKMTDMVLLTNGRGGMARICADLGRVQSKYDCVLGANLHPELPVDRHVFAKRIRVWVNADGFISPLNYQSVKSIDPGPPATWNFVANAGDGRSVEIQMNAEMLPEKNSTVFRFSRPSATQARGKQLPTDADVRLTVRLDIEDRSFHCETKRNSGAEYHFASNTRAIRLPGAAKRGFEFTPAPDRVLRVYSDAGTYHEQPEWCEIIPHPVEQSRGQMGSGDAYSPGWFELPLIKGGCVTLVVNAEKEDPKSEDLPTSTHGFRRAAGAAAPDHETLEAALLRAVQAFVVKRGEGRTVIAGYPWFLDWGRDTFICARGLLAAGMQAEVQQILVTFARFEHKGTLPNTIFGADASNRDTTDAPLWFAVVAEELARRCEPADISRAALWSTAIDDSGKTLRQVLESIATHYRTGTPNGIRVDPESGLVWSPSHFTWMDTNYPAGTPREGYPVEIQALWFRLLNLLAVVGTEDQRLHWRRLATQVKHSFETLFWLEEQGWYSDVLLAHRDLPAARATCDDALRSNCLFVVSLGLSKGEHARRCVEAARKHLVIPGALRSLAPLPVRVPLRICGANGKPLNDPLAPYWGRYEGDEDTRRKPAYHNGTAWTWTFPVFCEALATAWELSPESRATARAYLGSVARLLEEGCLGHLPEVLDGDFPHQQRGCDAQAWGATEALRVWRLLQG